jgi:hypothetical protein
LQEIKFLKENILFTIKIKQSWILSESEGIVLIREDNSDLNQPNEKLIFFYSEMEEKIKTSINYINKINKENQEREEKEKLLQLTIEKLKETFQNSDLQKLTELVEKI